MRTKTMVAAGVVAVSIAAGAGAGALLFTPGVSGAQSTTSTTAPANPERHGGFGRFGVAGGDELSVAAKAIGISESDLRTALQSGKTIADVAKDHGVDVQKVVDALVADAKSKLQQLENDLPTRMNDLVNGKLPTGKGFRGGPGGPGFGANIKAEAAVAAQAIGISETDLVTALRSGKSIAEVAKDHNVDVNKVIDAIVADSTKRIDDAVTNGKLTSDQATSMKANLKQRVTDAVNRTGMPFGRARGGRHGGPDGGFDGPPGPDTSASASYS